MPQRIQWEPDYGVGHTLVDEQHRGLLDQCNLLAELCLSEGDAACDSRFDQAFDRLQALAREHFEAETALLARCGYAELEDHRFACDEFAYLVDEVITTENFSRVELQRFLALWWVGHIAGSAPQLRALLAGRDAPA
ncbi:MAG TPA: hemerythrin family protein [Rubrivivax sp.]|nr:hemerythrin family protein [Rubrivivax sp.]